ncbi:MAG TPA: glycine cleavage system protein GcvH [Halanaerobiales bacterium]|nr:glycine cleavage system protein GcvH [Halanaerobiales bacterium]
MSIPNDLFYTENHEWISVDGKDAVVGITDHAQEELGDIVFVELPSVEEEVDQFEEFGVIESVKAVSDVFMPASGVIVEVNEELMDRPELINEDPYGSGWLIKIEIKDKDELEELMDSTEYEAFLEEE